MQFWPQIICPETAATESVSCSEQIATIPDPFAPPVASQQGTNYFVCCVYTTSMLFFYVDHLGTSDHQHFNKTLGSLNSVNMLEQEGT